jgi:hypothetical protein
MRVHARCTRDPIVHVPVPAIVASAPEAEEGARSGVEVCRRGQALSLGANDSSTPQTKSPFARRPHEDGPVEPLRRAQSY